MSNGHVCCLLAVCCPPDNDDRRSQALFEEMNEAFEADATFGDDDSFLRWAASWIVKNFDLVPKGVGRAIVEGYAPEFAKKYGA